MNHNRVPNAFKRVEIYFMKIVYNYEQGGRLIIAPQFMRPKCPKMSHSDASLPERTLLNLYNSVFLLPPQIRLRIGFPACVDPQTTMSSPWFPNSSTPEKSGLSVTVSSKSETRDHAHPVGQSPLQPRFQTGVSHWVSVYLSQSIVSASVSQ